MKKKSIYQDFEVALLTPHPKNPKEHNEQQIDKLVKSINAFDWTQPIVCDENYQIIIGHGRYLAAKKANLKYAPVWVLTGYSEDEKVALMIADNKLNMETGWIESNLEELLKSISKDYSVLDDLGFADLDSIFDKNKELDDKFVPPLEVPKEEQINQGDILQLNNHVVLCGDSSLPKDVIKLFDGRKKPFLMVTDPPYGVNYDPQWRNNVGLGVGERSLGTVQNDNIADWRDVWKFWEPQVIYCWHAGRFASTVQSSLEEVGLKIISQIIWVKQHFALSRGDYHWQHEPCWYAARGEHRWQGARDQSTIWEIKNNNAFGNANAEERFGHGTQKPLECMARPIRNNSEKGDTIADPFLGSGTTLIAADMLGRNCIGAELSPEYCRMIVNRFKKYCYENDKEFALKINEVIVDA